MESQSPLYKQNKIVKVDISLKQLLDVDTTNELAYRRLDNIQPNQVLTSYTNRYKRDAFRFKYLTDLIVAGSGVTITNNSGILTIAATGGGTGTVTSVGLTAGTGISLSGTNPITTSGTITVTNSAPDQTVALTAGSGVSITGTYPNFTIASTATSGMKYGVASGTNNYTVTISGVTGYVDGDAYIIKFTNGNDADSDIDINGLGVKTLVKEFNVQLTGGDIVSGQDLIIIYDGTNFQTLGVAPNQLFAYVTNDDSVTITKGQPVYAFGAAGNRMSVKLANNSSDATSAQTVGVVYSSSIAPNQRGFIITQGVISGVNTAAYSPGDQLYLGATAGSLTATKPYAPNHLVYIGIVERANAGNGQIYVKPQNGYELKEIHDVDVTSTPPVNNDVLVFDTSTTPDLWKPKSIPTILGYTPANIDSPAFTGTPTAPTATAGTNTTQIATTAFVQSAAILSANQISIFGDGLNGAATITAQISLTEDTYYTNLTISGAGAINLAGYRLFVNGTLDLSNAGSNAIANNGYFGSGAGSVTGASNGGGGTQGRGGYGVTTSGYYSGGTGINVLYRGGNGGNGASPNTNNAAVGFQTAQATSPVTGGAGGSGGKGGDSAIGTGAVGGAEQAIAAGTFFVRTFVPNLAFLSRTTQNTLGTATTTNAVGGRHGGGGGGGGSSTVANGGGGGAGGGGGGNTIVYARNIIVGASTASDAIAARGGSGNFGGVSGFNNTAGGGGSGGGGGGYVYLVYGTVTGGSYTFVSANGGTGGNGGNGNGTGLGGQGGQGGSGGRITAICLGNNTITQVNGTGNSGAIPAIPTTTAGSAGGAGGTCTFSS